MKLHDGTGAEDEFLNEAMSNLEKYSISYGKTASKIQADIAALNPIDDAEYITEQKRVEAKFRALAIVCRIAYENMNLVESLYNPTDEVQEGNKRG